MGLVLEKLDMVVLVVRYQPDVDFTIDALLRRGKPKRRSSYLLDNWYLTFIMLYARKPRPVCLPRTARQDRPFLATRPTSGGVGEHDC
jgi:hypothetical protein